MILVSGRVGIHPPPLANYVTLSKVLNLSYLIRKMGLGNSTYLTGLLGGLKKIIRVMSKLSEGAILMCNKCSFSASNYLGFSCTRHDQCPKGMYLLAYKWKISIYIYIFKTLEEYLSKLE